MSKKLILVLALSLVLASGGLFSALADCGCNMCNGNWFSSSSYGSNRDMDWGAYNDGSIPNNGLYVPSPWPPGQ
ncbi:MAG: hypothetical protein ACLQJ7_11865 [Syntrophobacteraceae bacterium]